MATYHPRRFTRPDTLQALTPFRLYELLAPHEEYLAARGFRFVSRMSRLDYEHLSRILLTPGPETPGDLLSALFFVNEMATPQGMDSLLPIAIELGLRIDESAELTPADVALEVWLCDRELLQRKHAEQCLRRPRLFEYFQTVASPIPPFVPPSEEALRRMEDEMDGVFAQRQRGYGTRISMHTADDGIWFLICHGDPFRRVGTLEGGRPSSVAFRPQKYDVAVYRPKLGEICINARSPWEKELYRSRFGRYLFGDENFFPAKTKYTLEPLRTDGEASLNCIDVQGMESVKLREVHYYWGGAHNEVEIRRADDMFEALRESHRDFPTAARLVRATFQVKFSDSRSPRSVVIRPSNIAQYTRDTDSALVEDWLDRRGFIRYDQGEAYDALDKILGVA